MALLVAASTLGSAGVVGLTPAATAAVPDGTRFFVPTPNPGAVKQVSTLTTQGRKSDAAKIQSMIDTPTGVWVTTSSPEKAESEVDLVTARAATQQTLPLLVLYNIPFRDCAHYSAGGATSVTAYREWVDAVARGIGARKAAVAIEPDGLGIVPWYTKLDGTTEWCKPAEADAATAADDRFALLRYAVERLKALPNTTVYLDGTQNGWLNVGEASDRLLKAGVEQADGFFLNASNFQYTTNLEQYGTWVSSCMAYVTQVKPGDYASCAHQYWNGGPANNWTGVALDPMKIWSDNAADPTANTAGINSRYFSILGAARPTKTFLIDTSRNGRGPWTPTRKQVQWPDPQTWCNPPGRGLGLRPTTATRTPLADAYVWLKVPGESDGQCSRGLGSGTNVVDPAWNRVDPAAGAWFPEQALELAQLSTPLAPASY